MRHFRTLSLDSVSDVMDLKSPRVCRRVLHSPVSSEDGFLSSARTSMTSSTETTVDVKMDEEKMRVEKLHSYQILNTSEEEQFDRIVRICSKFFNAPICMISLLDETQQFLKSKLGYFQSSGCPKELTFCNYAINDRENDVFVVLNASEHQTFCDNPFVKNMPNIKFYAGAKLTTSDGHNLGTLCIMDFLSRDEFGPDDRRTLKDLALLVMDELDLRKRNQDLEVAKEKAEASHQLKSSFLAHMSHEIRTPLSCLLGFIDILHSDTSLNEEHRQTIKLIKESGSTLQQILSDILDLSKIEANQLNLETTPFRAAELVQQVTDIFKIKASEKGIQLHSVYNPCISNSSNGTVLNGDPTRIKQVLWNLVSNGLKFTSSGGVTIRVTEHSSEEFPKIKLQRPELLPFSAMADSKNNILLLIEVEDTGIGLNEIQLQKIFSPFVQGDDSTTRKYGGTGLGLSIVQKLVKLMGGNIGVQSTFGTGSTFWLSLCLSPKRTISNNRISSARLAADTPSPRAAQRSFNKLRLLVVDDNSTIRMLMSRKLQGLGYEFSLATNGEEALKEFDKGEFDVIMCDMFMPVMDGVQVITEIRNSSRYSDSKREIPIIAFTADVLNESVEHYLSIGANYVLGKPIDFNRLQEMLQTVSNL